MNIFLKPEFIADFLEVLKKCDVNLCTKLGVW